MNKEDFLNSLSVLKKRMLKNEKIRLIKNRWRENDPDSQYGGVVFWNCITFKNDYCKEYKGRKIIGINIMPYQITREDIIKAKINNSNIKFNKTDEDYRDFDYTSGNFHKHIYNGVQIVLIDSKTKNHYGIGLFDDMNIAKKIFNSDDINLRNEYANKVEKSDVYYPNIDDITTHLSVDNLDELEDAIISVLIKIGVLK